MDEITLKRIEQAHPKVRERLLEQYKEVNSLLGKGVRLRFAYVYRSPEEQRALFKKRPKVTNADAWQSIHNYGLAFDIVLLIDKDGDGNFETVSWDMAKDFDGDKVADWMEVTNYFKSKGWEWGGDWKTFKDFPHFEMNFGFDWKALKQRIDKGIIIKDSNRIVYPLI
ncbi:M15 family metallopeptidase [Flavobacterium oreochromis]|uniref:M15 family metallopeptidase n=1 Tax=Flavobacterium oreochromis TaxID=2906078 RepID=UPI001CE53366|nr:M15 family metallopeptidase [Flavobacterium oreochromis]QYS85398.1 M15 family metallopeptidase [Flavobacterium oreochromis]